MRLIDADKLKMTTITRWNGDVDFVVYKEELDNAPTVIAEKQTEPTDGDLYRCSICGRSIILYKGVSPKIHPYCCNIKMKPIVRGELVKNGSLTSEELFALDIEQNVKDIDSGEDDSYYRGRLAGMLSAYRILKGKPYEGGSRMKGENQ